MMALVLSAVAVQAHARDIEATSAIDAVLLFPRGAEVTRRAKVTVDKGEPDRLVSLCMDGIKKVSPTRFEVIKTDYEPTRDLDLLFVTFAPIEGGQ